MQDSHSRLSICFVISFGIHTLLVALLLWYFLFSQNFQFKSGTGQIPNKIKISGFIEDAPKRHIATPPSAEQSGDDGQSNANTPQLNTSTQSQASALSGAKLLQNTPEANKEKNNLTPKDSLNQAHTNQAQQNLSKIDLNSLTLNSQSATQKGKRGSIAQAFARHNYIDEITKKDIFELYGEEFGDYGLVEQDFIINNLRDIGRITQRYLKYPPDAIRLGQQGKNVVEFYLHPNGDITELRIIKSSGYEILDRNSERTIELAYKDYPHPVSKVRIRIFVDLALYY